MHLAFDDRVAVVTGGTSGIGLAVCHALAHAGATVVACSRSAQDAALPDGVTAFRADLGQPGEAERLAAFAQERHGRVDILINNVGASEVHAQGFLGTSDAAFQASLDINFFSAVRMCRAVLPGMVERGSGAVVNVSSVTAVLPDPSVADYAVAKAALAVLSKTLAMEFAPAGIRVNTITPGPVDTPMMTGEGGVIEQYAAALGVDAEAVHAGLVEPARVPLGRMSTAEEIAALVVFLVSDAATSMSGSNVVVDGGLIKTL